jgi:Ca2+:H+ antiporter
MSGRASQSSAGFRGFVRCEYSFFIGLALALVFLALGNEILENVAHPHALGAVFICLFGGAIVAGLVLAPEALSAVKAATRNQLQRSVNILHGSVLASIGLTIPAVLIIGMTTKRSVTLGIEGGNMPLLLLTFGASIVTFGSGKTNILQGCIHLLLFAVFLLLIFCP